jgi:Glycosyl hydrolases family 39
LVVLAVLLSLFHLAASARGDDEQPKIEISWESAQQPLKTAATLQVVVNPPLRRGSPIHDTAWNALKELPADYIRYVPWYPYPKLSVAELEPPADGKTSWDFSAIDPMTQDFFAAASGRTVMLNFSTIPQWMYKTAHPVAYPNDANEVSWNYEQGTELRDPSGTEVADYYARLVSWYTRGFFVDELGKRHESGHHYKIGYWEVLNEPDFEHQIDAQTYTRIYDAVVEALHKVSPETKFVGMSLATPTKSADFFEYFLNAKNHAPGTPLDMISYHFYAVGAGDQGAEALPHVFFEQADKFLDVVGYIEAIRKRLSPATKTTVNETGCILPADIGQSLPGKEHAPIPDAYWNLCGAVFAYVYAGLARQGIDVVGESQLLGYPTQFPSVTMLDWKTGEPNARYGLLKLLLDNFRPGDRLAHSKSATPYVTAQGNPYTKARRWWNATPRPELD